MEFLSHIVKSGSTPVKPHTLPEPDMSTANPLAAESNSGAARSTNSSVTRVTGPDTETAIQV